MKTKKYYKVVLKEDHNANSNQVLDGCLLSPWVDGNIALYERGDAIKKAKMFNGNIKLVTETKFVFLQMISREGEYSTTVKTVHEMDIDGDMRALGANIARDYYNDDNVEDTGNEFLHNSGCIATSVLKVEQICYDDYKVLSKYL